MDWISSFGGNEYKLLVEVVERTRLKWGYLECR